MAIFLSATAVAATSAVISGAAGITSATLAMSRDLKASSIISSTSATPRRVHCRVHASQRSINGYARISGDLLMVGSTSDIEEILSVQDTQARLSGRVVEVMKAGANYLSITFDDTEQASVSLVELQAAAHLVQRSAFVMPPSRASKQKPREYHLEATEPSQHQDQYALRAKILEKMRERAQSQVRESKELLSKLGKTTADAEAKGQRVEELRLSMETTESKSKEVEDELANIKELCVSQELEIEALKERLSELQAIGVRTSSKSSCGSISEDLTSCGSISEDLTVTPTPRRLCSTNIEAAVKKIESLSADHSQYVTQSHDLGMLPTPRNIRLLSRPTPVWTQSRAESANRLRVRA